jgi:hypothetical protein
MYHVDNVYTKPPYNYNWITDHVHNHALPVDQTFYRDIFANGSKASMRMFEQVSEC